VDEIPKDPYKFDDDARNRFFAMLRETGRIYHAAKAAGISVSYIYATPITRGCIRTCNSGGS